MTAGFFNVILAIKKEAFFSYEGGSGNGINFAIQQPKNMVRVVGVTTINIVLLATIESSWSRKV